MYLPASRMFTWYARDCRNRVDSPVFVAALQAMQSHGCRGQSFKNLSSSARAELHRRLRRRTKNPQNQLTVCRLDGLPSEATSEASDWRRMVAVRGFEPRSRG